MELQFYEPGYVPQFDGFGCTATQWCANLTIDSLSRPEHRGRQQRRLPQQPLPGRRGAGQLGVRHQDGKSQAPANPLALSDDPNARAALNPDPTKDLMMNPGDTIRVHMHDTPAGIRVDITDLTTGEHGSMTASIANGFGQVLYEPNATEVPRRGRTRSTRCTTPPSPRGNTWAAHTNNVAFSDEIGHFEYCDAIDAGRRVHQAGRRRTPTVDEDDQVCLDGADFDALIPINGCLLDDGDFDGASYQRDWPGRFRNPFLDRKLHPTPVRFTVPTSGGQALEQMAFETDLPRIERGEPGNPPPQCDAITGANCVNPPPGAQFYPIYTATRVRGRACCSRAARSSRAPSNTFGGNSKSEYGDLLFVDYALRGIHGSTPARRTSIASCGGAPAAASLTR